MKRLLCRLLGHTWAPRPAAVAYEEFSRGGPVRLFHCKRCGELAP